MPGMPFTYSSTSNQCKLNGFHTPTNMLSGEALQQFDIFIFFSLP